MTKEGIGRLWRVTEARVTKPEIKGDSHQGLHAELTSRNQKSFPQTNNFLRNLKINGLASFWHLRASPQLESYSSQWSLYCFILKYVS